MPFGNKESNGIIMNFDSIYKEVIKPSISDAGIESIRADEEIAGGIIHKPMFERLMFCDYAICDLTTANANVFYELGIRHAIRPYSTVLICAKGNQQLPFDIRMLRVLYYPIKEEHGTPDDIEKTKDNLKNLILEIKQSSHRLTDSPLFQLIEDYQPPDIKHLKTDLFLQRVQSSNRLKNEIEDAKEKGGVIALREIEKSLDIINTEYDVVISLFLAYRSVQAWNEMIELVEKMSKPLAEMVMVQEQLALALNRNGQSAKAEKILLELIEKKGGGGTSETFGILGRIYKDRWEKALKENNKLKAAGFLNKAIDSYLKGFESDWRDAYPGINAVTLMEIRRDPSDNKRRKQILPIVRYAAERRMATKKPDYWDYATLIELAILDKDDESTIIENIANALSFSPDKWQVESTLRTINMVKEARERTNESPNIERRVIEELEKYIKY
jgi:tetratricopeptide (TPR) repeat protein